MPGALNGRFAAIPGPPRIARRGGRDLAKDVQGPALGARVRLDRRGTSSRSSPSTSAACEPVGLLRRVHRALPRHQRPALAQQRRRVLAQHRQRRERPRRHHVERRLVQLLRARARDAHVLERPAPRSSAPATRTSSRRSPPARPPPPAARSRARGPGSPAPEPRSAIRARLPHRVDLQADQRVRDVDVLRPRRGHAPTSARRGRRVPPGRRRARCFTVKRSRDRKS